MKEGRGHLGSSARALFLVGLAFSRLQLAGARRALPRLGRKAGQTSVRYGGTCPVLYCTDGLWAQAWPLTDWRCSFQLWCACSKKAGILPSTALIRL